MNASRYFRWRVEDFIRNRVICSSIALAVVGVLTLAFLALRPVKFCDAHFHLISVQAFRGVGKTLFFQSQWTGWAKEGLRIVRKQDPPVHKLNIRMYDQTRICLSVAYKSEFSQSQLETLSAELQDNLGKVTRLGQGSYAGDYDGKTHISFWIYPLLNTNRLSYLLRLRLPDNKPVAEVRLGRL